MIELDLHLLAKGLPGLTPAFGRTMIEAAVISFSRFGHSSGVKLSVSGSTEAELPVVWETEVTPQLERSYTNNATELGAECVGICLTLQLTEYTVIRRAWVGTGFDYYLGRETEDSHPFDAFAEARLEISGIKAEAGTNTVRRRLSIKVGQVEKGETFDDLPVYFAIVEFNSPKATFTLKG